VPEPLVVSVLVLVLVLEGSDVVPPDTPLLSLLYEAPVDELPVLPVLPALPLDPVDCAIAAPLAKARPISAATRFSFFVFVIFCSLSAG
jgi:hypothetical protein